MAWFKYEDQPIRRYRKGIWLRVKSLPDHLKIRITAELKKQETIAYIKIYELQTKNRVLLEIWCYQDKYPFNSNKAERYTVFYLSEVENPDWVCESDIGRGLVKKKEKQNAT